MPTARTISVYKFEELSPRAKERARQWFREGDETDNEFIYNDAAECGAILGIEIDRRDYKTVGGATLQEPAIYYSGFSSQGDGACFEGRFSYAKRAPRKIRQHAPQNAALHSIADDLYELQRAHWYRLEARVKHSGQYYHEFCTDIDVTDKRTGNDVDADTHKQLADILRRFMKWIYRQLEAEYEWRSADEQVDEAIKANEYEFDVDGNNI